MSMDSINGMHTVTTTPSFQSQNRTSDSSRGAVEASVISSSNPEVVSTIQSEETGTTTGENGKESSENHLKSVLSVANEKIRMTNTRCEFKYHDKTNRVSIKVIDKDTDEIIRELPPEETLEMVEKMWELAGLFIDERR